MKRLIKKSTIIITIVAATIFMSEFSTYAVANNTKISGYTAPTTLTEGQTFSIKGQISSNQVIKRVEIGVVYANTNKWTSFKYDNNKVNSKSFNIAKYADPKIRFGKIKAGTYYYRIYAHTADRKVTTLLNKRFVISSPIKKTSNNQKSSSSSTSKTEANKATVLTVNTSVGGAQLKNTSIPGNYKSGSKFNPRGVITSKETIKKVEIGIVFALTNKWTEYKYEKNGISTKAINISSAASALKFDQLPAGTYWYRIYVHTTSGVKTLLNKKFIVKPGSESGTNVNKVKLAHAAHGEKGITGCKPGDQTGEEVCVTNWGYNSNPSSGFHWNAVLRCKEPYIADQIAKTAIKACNNPHIGYDQGSVAERQSFYKALVAANWDPSKITKDVETSCSPFACACINAGFRSRYIKTDHSCTTLYHTLKSDRNFICFTTSNYCTSSRYLKPGDILITLDHHCAIVVK